MIRFRSSGIFKSIFIKFTMAFIAIGLLPLLLFSYVFLNRFSQNIETFSINNFEQMVIYGGKNVDKVLEDYNNISKLMYSYNAGEYQDLRNILTKSYELDIKEGFFPTKKERLMNDFTRSILYANEHLRNVIFIDQLNKKVYFNTNSNDKVFDYGYDFFTEDQYKEVVSNKKNVTILPPHVENYIARSNRKVITVARNYLDLTQVPVSDTILGTVLLDVDLSVFDDIFNRLNFGDMGNIYVIDEGGNCIYSKDSTSISEKLDWYVKNQALFTKNNNSGYTTIGNSYYIFNKTTNSSWTVIYQIDKKDILKKVDSIKRFVNLIVILSIAGLTTLAVIFSNGFSLPIKRIIRQMKKVESGELDVMVDVRSKDEVGQLAVGFNKMVQELRSHIDRSYIAKIKQKEAEFNALKTQIRPHFLYNTLEVIRMSAVDVGDEKVADMIHSLSAQLKYVIGYNDDTVTLGQEIQMIKYYFDIIKVRYDERINLEVNIPEDLLELSILKLTLQPIVENAVEHGLKPKGGRGKVMITGEINNGNLEISIFDDGTGINSETLEKINKLLSGEIMGEKTPEGWKSVGIKNVQDRLKMNFGEGYGIDIKSYADVGTIVRMIVPIIKEVKVKNDKTFSGR